MANMESVYTYEGTDDIHTFIFGRYLTGIKAITRGRQRLDFWKRTW